MPYYVARKVKFIIKFSSGHSREDLESKDPERVIRAQLQW